MQSDRELLERAAKAAGYGVEVVSSREQGGTVSFYMKPDLLWWNPLEDDGDALRLAVKLRMLLHIIDLGSLHDGDAPFSAAITAHPFADERELHGADPCAATRRAIVRAAAAMAPKEPA